MDGDIRNIRVGVVTERLHSDAVEPETRDAVTQAIEVIKGLGAPVQEVSIPMFADSGAILWGVILTETAAVHYDDIHRRQEEIDHNMRVALLTGSLVPSQTYYKAQRWRQILRRQVMDVLEKVDVLVLPTQCGPAQFKSDGIGLGNKAEVKAGYGESITLTAPANLAGLPAITVPCGFTSGNLPLGLQIMGRPMDEGTLFQVGHAYQQATDWHTRRPPI